MFPLGKKRERAREWNPAAVEKEEKQGCFQIKIASRQKIGKKLPAESSAPFFSHSLLTL